MNGVLSSQIHVQSFCLFVRGWRNLVGGTILEGLKTGRNNWLFSTEYSSAVGETLRTAQNFGDSGVVKIPLPIRSAMRPLYFLWNKILTVDEDIWEEKADGSDGDDVNAGEWQLIQPSSGGRKWQDQALPRSHFVEVPHVKQLHSWDCGLACVLMALNTVGINHCSIQALTYLCCTTSIWTVDLAYLLQRFSVPFSYFTVTLGANPNYSAETFYKEQLPNDLVRVDMLFQNALERGINIQCRSITENQISQLILSKKYIAIALVDQYKLSRSLLKDFLASGLNSNYLGYAGHYVVICGYDACTDEFEIRDPASSRNFERISSKCLEEARKSFGTDEDLLLISLDKCGRQNSSSMPLVHVNTYL